MPRQDCQAGHRRDRAAQLDAQIGARVDDLVHAVDVVVAECKVRAVGAERDHVDEARSIGEATVDPRLQPQEGLLLSDLAAEAGIACARRSDVEQEAIVGAEEEQPRFRRWGKVLLDHGLVVVIGGRHGDPGAGAPQDRTEPGIDPRPSPGDEHTRLGTERSLGQEPAIEQIELHEPAEAIAARRANAEIDDATHLAAVFG